MGFVCEVFEEISPRLCIELKYPKKNEQNN